MNITIRTKLTLMVSSALIIFGLFFVVNMFITKDVVLGTEKENVTEKVSELIDNNLKGQIDTVTLSVSNYYNSAKFENVKASLADEISTFASTVEQIYQNSGSEDAVFAFLNNYRWGNGRYIFAYDADSIVYLANGANTSIIGTDASESEDVKGIYFAQDIVSSAKQEKIGFSSYYFDNPSTGKVEEKLSASIYFAPMNMVIATGEYINTLRKDKLDSALETIRQSKYGKNGYFWVQDEKGTILTHPKEEIIGQILGNTSKIANDIKGKTEAFTYIEFENPATKQTEQKIAYSRTIFPDWGWTIVTGTYASDITEIEQSLTTSTADIFNQKVYQGIGVGSVIIIVSLAITLWTINSLVRGLVGLRTRIDTLSTGEADLTSRVEITSKDELGDIGNSVNNFIIYLQSMIKDVTAASTHITSSIEELKIQSENTNQALVTHSAETEQVVTAITEMSATAETVAQSAADTAENTKKAGIEAQSSKKSVTEASVSMSSLMQEVDSAATNIHTMNNNTKEIVNVLGVIGDIAEQTNLLALNAAIEAARAGEQGRGFAVVADEVRALASRTQTSTKEINDLLDRLQRDASQAVSAMDETKMTCETTAENADKVAQGLDSVSNSIVEINDLSTQIATASEQQSSVTEEVNRNMTNIREMVLNLTDNGKATLDSTQSLAAANEQLSSLVSKFKV
ncbi:methyl-accepting chemotaxis protein [Vibrio sp. 99-8-1]|uniref:methyl-accepting chemotaxis protein n=1 Tax=Vibrio sp. 99-8-1 TaxID=2607602 RepID=UPI0014938F55|nr:methyl-accepting chemotaxis protein [Vibrio sp. 99-8-1]NOI67180.1 methyl-accepting chemotaxis protein [Vibrio sp. 99-8-1]